MEEIKKYLIAEDLQQNTELFINLINTKNNINEDFIDNDLIYKTNLRINTELYNDLEIFKDLKNDKNTVFNKLNNTSTIGGSYYLKKLLENPINNITFLNNKKNSLMNLFNIIENNKNIFSKLQKLKETENDIFWILNDKIIDENLLNILYFNNYFSKYLNNSSYILTTSTIFKIFVSPVVGILSPIIYFILPYMLIRFKFNIKFNFISYIKFMFKYYMNMNFGQMMGKPYLDVIRKIWMLFTLIFYFNSIFNSIELGKLTYKLNNIICDHMDNINIYINNGFEIFEILYNQELFKNIFNIKLENLKDNEFLLNLKNLKKCKNEYFNNFGEKLKLYKILEKDILLKFVNITYLCDTICSLYLLKKNNNLVYPNYINSTKPYIKIKGLHHPNIDKNKVIKNDIILDNNNNLIITGPNAGGKSTFIKSIAINILLSQTLCINFCDDIGLTPFYYISSQINIVDNKGYESLFEAEMNRIVKNYNIINECNKNNKFSILFLDELFNSTNMIEGISGSYGICKKLSEFNNNITLLTTHYTYLYKLKDTGKFKNYKMNAIIDKDKDKITFPYKICKGVSKQYIALELLKNNLVENKDILEESIKFKQKILKLKLQ
jgi:DNA mismatch repair ATPase MutS